jgi:hypothetical protein
MPFCRRIALTLLSACAAALGSAAPGFAQQAKGTIELEVLLGPGVSPIEAQKWGEMLEGIPVENLSLRSGQPGEMEKLDNYGTAERPLYKIKGILTDRGQLLVPGGTFGFGDKAKLIEYLNTLKTKGDGALFDKPKMFGLGSKDLVETYKVLQVALTEETKGRPSKEVILEILKLAGCKSTASADAKKAILVEQPVLDELKGLSAGTALASVLRPLGLVFYPSLGADKSPVINMIDVRETKEPWPIGWPLNKAPHVAVPNYRQQINVSFDGTPFREVMDAIAGRLGAPILFDHNSMVRNRFDAETDAVTLPEEKLSYARILEKVSLPRRLGFEMRMDEAGAPFIWIHSKGRPKVASEEDTKPILGGGIDDRK